jgi:class 3 adenylate cyclase
LADNSDPDTLSEVLNEYLSEMADIAFHYGGTVDKFIGDAIMVIFGAPLDANPSKQVRQCLRMALAMHRRTAELNESWLSRGLLLQAMISRMGVHTGDATVGSFGSQNRGDYTAIGRSVNLASRLEGQCTPGRILVSADTWRYVSNVIPSEPRGTILVKGFAAPIEVYEIDPAATIDADSALG